MKIAIRKHSCHYVNGFVRSKCIWSDEWMGLNSQWTFYWKKTHSCSHV